MYPVCSVKRGYPHREPPLTHVGVQQASNEVITVQPDLVIASPMACQTALIMFRQHLDETNYPSVAKAELQVWPDLHEAHDGICNKGVSRAELEVRFHQTGSSEYHLKWNYSNYGLEEATEWAERVRLCLKALSETYTNIYVVTHRAFISFLARDKRATFCGVNLGRPIY